MATTLSNLGIKVDRPDRVIGLKKIKTLTYETEASSANNVRDLTLVYNNTIVETPITSHIETVVLLKRRK